MDESKKKHKGFRQKQKYPGLVKKANRTNIQKYMDMDYIDKLSDKEKEFLNKFIIEHYSADFRHEKPLIKSKKKRKEIYNNNNARNRDLYSYYETHQKLDGGKSVKETREESIEELEDRIDILKKFSK